MGNSMAKKRSRLGRLSTYELTRINEALDGLSNTDVSNGINAEVIQTLWKYELVPSLLQQYSKFLFPHANAKCSVEEFAQLYVRLTRGDYEERAITIAMILCEPEENVIHYNRIIKYVTDLTESYIRGVQKRKTREILSWHLRTNDIKEENILSVAKWWCHDLHVEEDQITMDNFERWLGSCGVLATIHREKLAALFGLEPDEDEDLGMLPLLMNPEAMGNNKSILDPVHILYLNFLLPTDDQREWRFLFSTSTHGESFSMLLGKIMEKGPTVIVISDEFNHVFGGFASQSWTLSPKFQGDEKCFLFTLSPEVQIFHPTGYNDHYMYLNYHQQSMPNGLGMGGQFNYFGFWLDAEFGIGKCSDVCTTFRKYKLLSANKTFNVRHLEIWGVGPAPLTAEEKGERPGILEKDPTARKILEMAGKPQHSAGMRENSSS